MLPAATGDEVPAPAMAQLVGDNVDVLAIGTNDRGCRKGKDGIFHSWKEESGGAGKQELETKLHRERR